MTIIGIITSILSVLLPVLGKWLDTKLNQEEDVVRRNSKRHDAVLKKHIDAVRANDAELIGAAWSYHDRMLGDRGIIRSARSPRRRLGGDTSNEEPQRVHSNVSMASKEDIIRARFDIRPRKV